MSFLWPQVLWLVPVVPALVAFYLWLLRRRSRVAMRFPGVAMVRDAQGGAARFRRHVPPLLLLLALTALIVAAARPRATITLPSEQRTVILAMDVSRSMRATDVEPSRIAAAQEAAKGFVAEQPADVLIGIVAFAGSATLVQKPTRDREALAAAIDQLQLQIHTAIGSGIIVALATLFPDHGLEAFDTPFGGRSTWEAPRSTPIDAPRAAPAKEWKPVPAGSYPHAAIILLTDGRRTIGPHPLDAARLAAERGVKVYTVGFGKADGGMAEMDGYSVYMRFDEETLKAVAALTAAEYFRAGSAVELRKVYEGLNTRFVLERKPTEITVFFAAAAAVLLLVAGGLSLAWHRVGAA
ncbi:MAG: VWA domain-containing protein [Betaproteobacteria bacterium]